MKRNKMTIVQIFKNVDLRKGEKGLAKLIEQFHYKQEHLADGYLYLFVNRKADAVKFLARRGVVSEKLPNPWDFAVPVNKAIQLLGKAFLFKWNECDESILTTFGQDKVKRAKLRAYEETLHSRSLEG